ncbi:bifunctional glutamate N-acetyltransferase/amino-acid acetyltransferase ArgJ [Paremcibacter congregatus]|uniref:bifunctional glutamate N-acetyltransferase/amino-acid acetyltransferase ArgJ n=1 Tax=Paremcibacter congregatus TaxID=2043170 RepID=UPI003A95D771
MAKIEKISPLAPKGFPVMPQIDGVLFATAATGMKYKGRDDLLCAAFPDGATVAGVLTLSRTASAPVDFCRANLATGQKARALLVNAGNSNAFTGKAGDAAMRSTVMTLAEKMGCAAEEIYVSSTGVIGEVLNADQINRHLSATVDALSPGGWRDAAGAILTTDTFVKGATRTVLLDGTEVTINGFAKGSGMIAPDMATMLGYIFTDADLSHDVLQSLLKCTADQSFNAITVDSDTSTSDTVLAFATGKSGVGERISSIDDPLLAAYRAAFLDVMQDLAHQVVRDGEGAHKFIEVRVCGAEDNRAAKVIAMSIANSPLVKTAIAGEDANWGRIVMAVGKAGEAADRDSLEILIGGQKVAAEGMAVPGYDEAACTAHLKGQNIDLSVDVGIGSGAATVWTCDLTHDYISINADYRS